MSPRAQNSLNTDKEVLNRFIPRARVLLGNAHALKCDRVVLMKKMASSEDEIFLAASLEYERNSTEYDTDDDILVAASQQYESQFAEQLKKEEVVKDSTQPQRFACPVSEEELLEKIGNAVPATTRKSTNWAVTVWDDWAAHRQSTGAGIPPSLDVINNEELNHWLSRFVVEVRTQKGDDYNSGSLYGLCAGVQRHVREKRSICEGEPVDILQGSQICIFSKHFR